VGNNVLDQHLLLGTKPATNAGLDDADVFDLHVDQWRQHAAGVEGHLRCGADNHAFVFVEPCDRDVILDWYRLHLVHSERLFEHVVGFGKPRLDVAAFGFDVVNNVAFAVLDMGCVLLVVDNRSTRLNGL